MLIWSSWPPTAAGHWGAFGQGVLHTPCCSGCPYQSFSFRGTEDPVTFSAKTVDHVLLPFDGAEVSEKVLKPFMDLGIFPAARHSLLHVVPLVPKHVVRGYALRTEWVPSRRHWIGGNAVPASVGPISSG